MNGIMKLFGNKIFKIVMVILNVIMIVILVCAIVSKVNTNKSLLENWNLIPQVEKDVLDVNTTSSSDDNILQVMGICIRDTRFNVGQYEFYFSSNGTFSGFFNDSNPWVEDYTYELSSINGDVYLYINNPTGTETMKYRMNINQSGQVELYTSDSIEPIVLEY